MASRQGKDLHHAGEFVIVEQLEDGPNGTEIVAYDIVVPDTDFHVTYHSLKDAEYAIDRMVAETAAH